jgi:hypothetical protein
MALDDHKAALAPKVQGSWNLHEYFASPDDLDFYIMLSSLIGVVGFASQTNYSAGGAFQDALARHRVERGLPGVSLDLGTVKSVGYLAQDEAGSKTIDALQRHGLTALSEDDVLAALGSAIRTPYAGALALGLNAGPAGHADGSALARDRRFACLAYQQHSQAQKNGADKTAAASGSSPNELAARLAAATTLEEATACVVEGLSRKLADMFMLPPEAAGQDDGGPAAAVAAVASRSLADFGVDSLVAVELRNMLALKAGAELSIFEIMQSPSVEALARAVAVRSRFVDHPA